MSLTGCIKKAGSALSAEDKGAILSAAQAYRQGGLKASEAAARAVDDQLASVRSMIASLGAPAMVGSSDQQVTTPKQAPKRTEARGKAKHPKTIIGSRILAIVSQSLDGLDPAWIAEFSHRQETKARDKNGSPRIEWRNPLIPGIGRLFRRGGTQDLQLLAEALEETGYLPSGSVEADTKEAGETAKQIVRDALNRAEAQTQDEIMAERQAEFDRRGQDEADDYAGLDPESAAEAEAERADIMAENDVMPVDMAALEDDDVAFDAPVTALPLADGMRAMGFDEQEIEDAVAQEAARRPAQAGAAEDRQDASQGPRALAQAGAAEAQPAGGGEGLTLSAQSPEDLKAKAGREAAGEEAERTKKAAEQARLRKAAEARDNKARADQSVDDFQLGQSADQQMSGMGDMFADAPAAQEATPAAARDNSPKAKRIRELEGWGAEYQARLAAYDPATAVEKMRGGKWSYTTVQGNSHPSMFDTKREAVESATRHRALVADMAESPTGYRDINSVLASKRLDVMNRLMGGGMSEMDAGEQARQQFPEWSEPAEVAKPAETAQAATQDKTNSPLEADRALWKRIAAGQASVEDFKAGFESWLANKTAITADFTAKKKDDLLQMGGGAFTYRYKSETKPQIVDALWRDGLSGYTLGRGYSYGMSTGSQERAIRLVVESTDADQLAQYAADLKAGQEEALARESKMAEAIKDPKTLIDYQTWMRATMVDGMAFKDARLMLTPEQRAAYDDLAAEVSRGSRKASADADSSLVNTAGQSTSGEIIATKHTKLGHDLWVVKLADRVSKDDYGTLLAGAKRLGGSYSSFRGAGAVPGFQFRAPDAAQAFLKLAGGDKTDAQAASAERRDAFADDRSQSAAERLTEMADRLDERADESLGRDRKTNTSRRAGQAASAEAAASDGKAMAKTMRNLATAIGNGAAKFLDRVRQKVQVEMLQNILRTAHGAELRAKFPAYIDQERNKGAAPTIEAADFAEFPTFTAYRSDLANLARQLQEVDGTKLIGQRLMKVADDVSGAYLEFAKANFHQVATFSSKSGGVASFGTSAAAEQAVARSGYKGKAIAYQVKRGEHTVIMSPSEAMARRVWKGDGDKRITLAPDLGAEMVEKIGRAARRGAKVSVPWQLESAYDRRKALARMGIETPAEMRAALREFISLREQAAAPDKVKQLERAMIGRRNDGMDFFPTPEATADEMVAAADIQPGMRVLEPSAGWGHIAERIKAAGTTPEVGELSDARRELLEAKGFNVVSRDFLEFTDADHEGRSFTYGDVFRAQDGTLGVMRGSNGLGGGRVGLDPLGADGAPDQRRSRWESFDDLEPVEKRGVGSGYDRILMNPPFSDGRDIQHVRHAFDLLKPGGRVVAIMGESAFTNQNKRATEFRDWLESVGGTEEKLPAGTFLDSDLPVNTGANARMVVIDKAGAEPDTQFSRTEGQQQPQTSSPRRQAVESLVQQIAARWANAPEVVVVESLDDPRVPEAVRREERTKQSKSGAGAPEGFFHEGKVYLIAEQLPGDADVVRVLFHEALGHFGLRGTFGPALGGILDRVAVLNASKVRAKAKQYGLDYDKPSDRRAAAEEVLAEMAQRTPDIGWGAKAVAAVRTWLRAHVPGFRQMALSDAEIVRSFIIPARAFVQRGGPAAAGGGGAAMFSRAGIADAVRDFSQAGARNAFLDAVTTHGSTNLWHRTVGTQYHKAQANPTTFGPVFAGVQDYIKETSVFANQAADNAPSLLPKLDSWRDLKKGGWRHHGAKPEDTAKAGEAIFQGTLDKVLYDDATLTSQFGLNALQIGLYREFRAATDESLTGMAKSEIVRLAGDEGRPVRNAVLAAGTAREAADIMGAHLADLAEQTSDDNLLTTAAEIGKKVDRIEQLQREGYAPLMRFGRHTLHVTRPDGSTEYFGMYETVREANKAARLLRGDPTLAAMNFKQGVMSEQGHKLFSGLSLDSLELFASATGNESNPVYQEYLKLAMSNRSAMKRMIQRKAVKGYSEDVARVLASFVTSNARMSAGNLHLTEAKKAAEAIPKEPGDLRDDAIELVEYVTNPAEEAAAVRGLLFTTFIGGSVASALVNLTQPITMTLPYLTQFGGVAKAGKRLLSAAGMVASGKGMSADLAAALKQAEQDGIVSPQEIHHLQGAAMSSLGANWPMLKKAAFVWGSMFSLAEQFNRRVSFVAAYQTAEQDGIADPFAFAEKAVIETQGLYNKGNKPKWARGAVGATVMTFKQFSIHYLEFLTRMWKSGPDGKKAVAVALALLLLTAGAGGLPFADDLDDLIDTLGQAMGHDTNSKRWKRQFIAQTLGLGDGVAEVATRGVTALPGMPIDLSLRMGMGNLLPATGLFLRSNTDTGRQLLEIAGAAGGLAANVMDGGKKILAGDPAGGLLSAAPMAVQNMAKAIQMWDTGEYRNKKGAKVMDVDAVDGAMKFIGFQPAAVARESSRVSETLRTVQLAKNVEGEIADQWAQGMADGNAEKIAAAKDELAAWNKANPLAPIKITMQQVRARMKALRTTRAERTLKQTPKELRGLVAETLN